MNDDDELAERIAEAEAALIDAETKYGNDHLIVAERLEYFVSVLKQNRIRLLDAANMEARSRVIRRKCISSEPTSDCAQPSDANQIEGHEGYEKNAGISPDEQTHTLKECPYCAEMIQNKAIICRYCHADLKSDANIIANDSLESLSRQKLCPNCHKAIKEEAILCKYCKMNFSVNSTTSSKSNIGTALAVASLLILMYAGTAAPYFAAVNLVPFGLILALVGFAMGNRLASCCAILLSLYMFQALSQHQAQMDSNLQDARERIERIQQDSQDYLNRSRGY